MRSSWFDPNSLALLDSCSISLPKMETLLTMPHQGSVYSKMAVASPHGHYIAGLAKENLFVFDTKTRRFPLLIQCAEPDVWINGTIFPAVLEPVASIAFSQDEKLLAVARTTDGVRIYDLSSGREIHPLKSYSCTQQILGFAGDHRSLTINNNKKATMLVSVLDGHEIARWQRPSIMAFSRDGRYYLTAEEGWFSRLSGKPKKGILIFQRSSIRQRICRLERKRTIKVNAAKFEKACGPGGPGWFPTRKRKGGKEKVNANKFGKHGMSRALFQ